jgi:putative membrane protein
LVEQRIENPRVDGSIPSLATIFPLVIGMTRKVYFSVFIAALATLWAALAIAPHDRADWLLENVLLLIGVAVLVGTRKRFPLSGVSYTTILVFLGLHIVGAHYTYAEVPYDEAFARLTGHSFNELVGWERNNYDRVVHFSYGLLLAYPIRELFLRVANVRGFWGYFLPLDLTMSTSMLYELVEWVAAEVLGGGLGAAFLGSQGDQWDAQKDMALASLGALITMAATAVVNSIYQRDFAFEWVESLRIRRAEPLGEIELARLRAERSSG